MIKKYLYIFLSLHVLTACKSVVEEEYTYFGGKIINPKSDYVTLHSQDHLIDSFPLNKQGKFLGKITDLNEGLYYFVHGNENQHVYLEPKDSLMLRLNTWDFDESIVFTGKGSERNNLLIDCFLDEENERNYFYQLYKLNPEEFKAKLDELILEKQETYNEFIETHPDETFGYRNVLQVALTYPLYSNLERYPIMHAKANGIDSFPELGNSYYDYRVNASIDNDSLMYFPPYTKYIRNYLYNKTYTIGHPPSMTKYSTDFTSDLLTTISQMIQSEESKNAFLKQTVISHFYNKSTCNIDQQTFDKFFELSTNKEDITHIKQLMSDTKYFPLRKRIVDFEVTDYLNTKHSIKKVIQKKNTFLFFWNPEYVSEAYIAARINYLKNEFKNIHFIQVNMQSNNANRIKSLDIKQQFYLNSDSKAHEFLSSKLPRAVLINDRGEVINGFASISSRNLLPYLKELN